MGCFIEPLSASSSNFLLLELLIGVLHILHHRGVFGVARFDLSGQCEGLHIVERVTDGSTLEPKCRRYYSDNQIYNDGNLMN